MKTEHKKTENVMFDLDIQVGEFDVGEGIKMKVTSGRSRVDWYE